MAIGDVRSIRTAKATVPNYTPPQPDSPFFPQTDAPAGIADDKTSPAPTQQARSLVEQRFMSMNAAHDRIRTQVLCAHDPGQE